MQVNESQAERWFTSERIGQLIAKLASVVVRKFQCSQLGGDLISLSLTNSGGTTWEWFGTNHSVPQYKKIGDMVYVKGLVMRTAGGDPVIANLPAGYRPANQEIYTTVAFGAFSEVRVRQNGDIELISGGANWVSLQMTFTTL